MKAIIIISGSILISSLIYLVFAFSTWEMSPSHWHIYIRVLFTIFTIVSSFWFIVEYLAFRSGSKGIPQMGNIPPPPLPLNSKCKISQKLNSEIQLTNLEIFAAFAMQGILANQAKTMKSEDVAKWSILCAKNLILQLNIENESS